MTSWRDDSSRISITERKREVEKESGAGKKERWKLYVEMVRRR